jgi:hypothetical protein
MLKLVQFMVKGVKGGRIKHIYISFDGKNLSEKPLTPNISNLFKR